jgi:DNA-binding response OmpR family regulator
LTSHKNLDAFPSRLKRRRVLFIEHDRDMREMMCHVLSQAGIEAVTSDSVSEGLLFARCGYFDLILLDWHLHDGDGLELCRAIRAFNHKTPVYLTCGWTHRGRHRQAAGVGAQGVLLKPIGIYNLLGLIAATGGTLSVRQAS